MKTTRTQALPCLQALLVIGLILQPLTAFGENCFNQETSLAVPFEVIRIGAPSFNSKTGEFADTSYYPATMVLNDGSSVPDVRPISKEGVQFKYAYNLWANRCVNVGGVQNWECPNFAKTKGNYFHGAKYIVQRNGADREVRPIFTTYAKANACSRIQAGFILGYSESTLRAMAANNGLLLVHYADRPTVLPRHVQDIHLPNGGSDTYFVNLCLLDKAPMGDAGDAIAVDYEVQDSRPESSTTNVLQQLATMAHNSGKKLIVYTNDMEEAMPRVNGITQNNIGTILSTVDSLAFTVWSGASLGGYQLPVTPRKKSPVSNMYANINFVTNNGQRQVDYTKLEPWIDIYGMTAAEAAQIYSIVRNYHMKGIYVPNSGMVAGGSCSTLFNQVIANLVGSHQPGSYCKIALDSCPTSPSKAGIFIDSTGSASESRCMQRAQDFYNACQIPPTSGKTSTAVFVTNGQVVNVKMVGAPAK